ncbi:hypothetical protein Gotur_026882 [Gossypium turneri]
MESGNTMLIDTIGVPKFWKVKF